MTRTCSCGATVHPRSLSGVCRSCATKRSNAARPQRNPVPADFAQRSREMTNAQIMEHYGIGKNTLFRWRTVSGVKATHHVPPQCRPTPIPDDFAELARSMTGTELAKHYGVSLFLIQKFRKRAGITGTVPHGNRGRAASNGNFRMPGARIQIDHRHRDMTLAGQAADYLRHYGQIFRCNERGGANPKGQFWNRGGHVLTDADVLDRARRLGFDPDSWRQIAA